MRVLPISISLMAALLTPASFAADSTFYGDFRYSLNNVDAGTGSTLSGQNNASRIGLKGTLDKEESISAFYHWQAGVNVDGAGDSLSQRFFLAGLKGEFGKVVYGRTSTPYKMAGLKLDPFYDTSAGAGFAGATYGLSGLTNGWSDNSFAYSSQKMGAFTMNGGLYIDDTAADEHDINLGAAYSMPSLSAGIQYLSVGKTGVVANSSADSTALRIHAKYEMGPWVAGASIESIEPSAGDTQSFIFLSATFQYTEKLKLAGAFGTVSDVSTSADGDGIHLGAFYQLLKKTSVSAVYSTVSADNSAGTDRDTLALAISHKFSLK